jgi:hypothetical protein
MSQIRAYGDDLARFMIADSTDDYVSKVLDMARGGIAYSREATTGRQHQDEGYQSSPLYDIKHALCERRERLFGEAVLQDAVDEWRAFLAHTVP